MDVFDGAALDTFDGAAFDGAAFDGAALDAFDSAALGRHAFDCAAFDNTQRATAHTCRVERTNNTRCVRRTCLVNWNHVRHHVLPFRHH